MSIKFIKNASAILLVALYILSLSFVVSCKAHEHVYGKWTGKDSRHYRVCECGDIKEAKHVWDGGSCLICKLTPDYTVNLAYEGVYDGWNLVGYAVAGRGNAEGNEITLPALYDGLPVSVKASAFSGDHFITSLNADGVTEIGANAFSACANLSSVNLGNGLISLGQSAFSSCTSLKNITLPDSLESIGSGAFLGCTQLERVNVPEKITNISVNTFQSCNFLKYIEVSENNEVYSGEDNGIIEKSTMKLIVGGTLGTVANGVKIVGANAFQFRNVSEVYIPASVEEVEAYAFSGCLSIKTVYYGGSAADWGKIKFDNGNTALTQAEIVFNYNI